MKLLHFFLIGALLFVANRMIEYMRGGPERAPIHISSAKVDVLRADFLRRHGAAPTDEQTKAMIRDLVDEEILIREARRLLLDRGDETVKLRLLSKMRTLGEAQKYTSEEELYQRAYALSLDEDTVIRRHLVHKMEILLARSDGPEVVTDQEVTDYISQNPELFKVAAKIGISQVFVREISDKRIQSIWAGLKRSDGDLKMLEALSDPFPLGLKMESISEEFLRRRYGEVFAKTAFATKPGVWIGPVESPFGFHFLRIEERPSQVADPVLAFRSAAQRSILREKNAVQVAEGMTRLRKLYSVIVEDPS